MNIRQIAPDNLHPFLREHPQAKLLDVREPWEHELAAIGGSTLIPLGALLAEAEEELPDRSVPIVVYCHHGIRSLQGCAILASLGYTDLINLAGGIDRYTRDVDPSVPLY
jgi:rhodanese-related sulfurtransferase